MKLTTVEMPGMFKIKEDSPPSCDGDPDPFVAYQHLPYSLGDICEPCWLTCGDELVETPDWSDHDEAVRPVGGIGCTHAPSSDRGDVGFEVLGKVIGGVAFVVVLLVTFGWMPL